MELSTVWAKLKILGNYFKNLNMIETGIYTMG